MDDADLVNKTKFGKKLEITRGYSRSNTVSVKKNGKLSIIVNPCIPKFFFSIFLGELEV